MAIPISQLTVAITGEGDNTMRVMITDVCHDHT